MLRRLNKEKRVICCNDIPGTQISYLYLYQDPKQPKQKKGKSKEEMRKSEPEKDLVSPQDLPEETIDHLMTEGLKFHKPGKIF